MKRYARLQDNAIVEIFEAIDLADLATKFHPHIVAGLVEISPDATPGMVRQSDGSFIVNTPATTIAAVKAEAARRILARYSFATQSNMNMRANELNDIRFDRALTPEEEAERQALKSIAAWINSVRAASNAIEARLTSDPYLDPATQPDWPA